MKIDFGNNPEESTPHSGSKADGRARLVFIRHTPHRVQVVDDKILWQPTANGEVIDGLPQIVWGNGTSWREVNLWALERANQKDLDLKTVESDLRHLAHFAGWLEEHEIDWWHFPQKKEDRCLNRYRGALIKARNQGLIAPSTATQRMAAVIKFYRWVPKCGWLSPDGPLWEERPVRIGLIDSKGFKRTIQVASTDLRIPNRKTSPSALEDGLRPVSAGDRDAILRFAKKAASRELSLMLTLGFFTGTRVGTIADLKIETLERAAPDPASPNLFRLAVGPRAKPPVHTKFGVTGHILMVRAQLDELRQYAVSRRRILREALAAPENKNLLFLTRSGNPYAQRGSDRSPAINVEMHTLRRKGEAREVIALRDFYFHCSRCTFATELARAAIAIGGSIDAIAIVQEALLHQNEATSLRYIRFVEKTAIRAQVASEYSELFLGIARAYQATERSEGDD